MTTPDAATVALAQRLASAYYEIDDMTSSAELRWLAVAREAQRWAAEQTTMTITQRRPHIVSLESDDA